MDNVTMPQIGEKAPEFQAQSTRGIIRFPRDFKGKWVILLSHPGAFHPVCASELQVLSAMQNQFSEKNCAIVCFSPDSSDAHTAWMRELEKHVPGGSAAFAGIPLVADDGGVIARRYGVWRPGATRPMRGIFIIDSKGTVRAVLLYPLGVGRNINEVFRLLLALQTFEADGISIPANWKPTDGRLDPVMPHQPMQHRNAMPVMDDVPSTAAQKAPFVEIAVQQPAAQSASVQPEPPIRMEEQVAPPAPPMEEKEVVSSANPENEQKSTPASDAAVNRHYQQPLRPVSQSVWDALAEAQPQIQPPQPAVENPVPPMPSFLHTQTVPKAVEHKNSAPKPEPVSKSGSGISGHPKAGGASISDQNRMFLGNLLDKEDAENGKTTEGQDYLIMRDFPYKNK